MFSAIFILFFLPLLGTCKSKSSKFIKVVQFMFWCFISNFIFLGWLGSCVVEQPYVLLSQLASIVYFSYFLFFLPLLKEIENKFF